MSPIVSHLLALLAGVLIGAAGQYFADRFTDQRRAQEAARERKRRFSEIEKLMPDLIAEMRADMLTDSSSLKREFFPYPIAAIYAPGPDKLYYDPEKHPDLSAKLAVLENHGYIHDVSVSETLIYRISEEFVALLRETKEANKSVQTRPTSRPV